MDISMWKDVTGLFLQLANIVIIGCGFYKFLNKPHDTLEEKHNELKKRVDTHDVEIKEIKESLYHGKDKFREHDNEFTTIWDVMLAFVDFEITYCHNTGYDKQEDLIRAKRTLEKYLASGRRNQNETDET